MADKKKSDKPKRAAGSYSLSTLSPAKGSRKKHVRVGRGIGSGSSARPPAPVTRAELPSGYSRRRGFEGGQMPSASPHPQARFS